MNLYVHIPFCLSKCNYCALYSIPAGEVPRDYPSLIGKEAKLRLPEDKEIKSIYFGGGTPGLLGVDGIDALSRELNNCGLRTNDVIEWTCELNPSPFVTTKDLLNELRKIGVNRLSFGVQSMDDAVLASMGRRHTSEDVKRAFAIARKCGFDNIGLDLIAGYPNVNGSLWVDTLSKALELKPCHISVYGLILEEGTVLSKMVARGEVSISDEDTEMNTLSMTQKILEDAGFCRYEISNYALEGMECLHNMEVWRGNDYLGLGPGAASRIGYHRETNVKDYNLWREELLCGNLVTKNFSENLSPEEDALERFLYAIRTFEGVSPVEFAQRHPVAEILLSHWMRTLEDYAIVGLVEQNNNGRWVLTERGCEVADAVIEGLMKE